MKNPTKGSMMLKTALELMRLPGHRLVKMHTNKKSDQDKEGQAWFIIPGGRVDREIAEIIIKRVDVFACEDGLFPGHSQTWQLGFKERKAA